MQTRLKISMIITGTERIVKGVNKLTLYTLYMRGRILYETWAKREPV